MPSVMREKLVRGFDAQEKQEIDKSHEDFMKLLKESNPSTFHENYRKFQEKNPQNQKNLQYRFILQANETLKRKFAARTFSLRLPYPIKEGYPPWTVCNGSLGSYTFQCIISCGHFQKLKLSTREKNLGEFDLMDHLSELMPNKGKSIGLFTFQNGINNSFEDFIKMGNAIVKNLSEKPLCIGIYNPTKGIANDLFGVLDKLGGSLSDTICITERFFLYLAEKLDKINPELLWTHIAHSEGGLIAETALTIIHGQKLGEPFKQKLLIATFGSVLPVPKAFAKEARNVYSNKDGATLPRVKSYLASIEEKSEDYKIEIINPSPSNQKFFYFFGFPGLAIKILIERVKGDHDFQGIAYQNALIDNITDFKRMAPIYAGK